MLPFLPLVLDLKIKNRFLFYFFLQLCIVFILSGVSKKAVLKYQSSVKKHNLEQ